jgi:hypothetical protein
VHETTKWYCDEIQESINTYYEINVYCEEIQESINTYYEINMYCDEIQESIDMCYDEIYESKNIHYDRI